MGPIQRLAPLLVACVGLAGCGVRSSPPAARSGSTIQPRATHGVTTLTSQRSLRSYQLASDAGGAATVIWTTEKFVGPENLAASVIRVRQQNARGGWSAPVQVGGVKQTDAEQLVESGTGAAAIVWDYVRGGSHPRTVLMAATRSSADRSWSAPKRIWSAPGANGLTMSVGIDATGVATVAWAEYGKTNPSIWVDTVNASAARVARPSHVVAPGAGGADPSLAENAPGAAVLSWQRQLSRTPRPNGVRERFAEMAAQRSSASGSWSAAKRLGTFSVLVQGVGTGPWMPAAPASVVTANGTAAVGWRAGGGGRRAPLEVSARMPGSASWTAPHTLTADPGGFGVVAGADNELVAVWSTATARMRALLTSTSANGERWSAPTRFASVRRGTFGPIPAAAPNGLIAITPLTGNHEPIQYATRSPAGRWSALRRVGTGDNPEATVTSHGSVTVLWETFSQRGPYRLKLRTLR